MLQKVILTFPIVPLALSHRKMQLRSWTSEPKLLQLKIAEKSPAEQYSTPKQPSTFNWSQHDQHDIKYKTISKQGEEIM